MPTVATFDPDVAAARRSKLVFDAHAIIAKAATDKRTDLTEEENTRYVAIEKELKDLATAARDYADDRAFDFLRTAPTGPDGRPIPRELLTTSRTRQSIGAQVIDAETGLGEWLKSVAGGKLPRHFQSPSIEVIYNAPITEAPLVAPVHLPGVVSGPMVPPTVRSLIPEGQATTNLITYSQETAATNAADAVSEGAAKPESSLTFTKASDAIRKIATWVPASRETFDDAPFFRSYLDARLRSFVDAETDNQILNGSGVDPDILGILNRAGLTPPHAQAAGENAFDAIAFQYGAIASSQYVLPDGVVLNPADWIRFLTTRTTTGEYLSGSPFEPFLAPRLWGMRVAQSPFLAPGQALVGSFLIGALLVLNGGMRIEVSTQHQDFFVRNLVAVLCEQRVALCILRPAAFGLATALTFTPPAP